MGPAARPRLPRCRTSRPSSGCARSTPACSAAPARRARCSASTSRSASRWRCSSSLQGTLIAWVVVRGFQGAALPPSQAGWCCSRSRSRRAERSRGSSRSRAGAPPRRPLSASARARGAPSPDAACGARRRRRSRDRDGRGRGSRRSRRLLRALPPAGRARLHRPGRGARLRRDARPRVGRDHARHPAARPRLHVADRPLHAGAHPGALAGAAAPLDALPRRRAGPADAARVQPQPRPDGERSPRSASATGQRRWRRCASASCRDRCSSWRRRSASRSSRSRSACGSSTGASASGPG